MNFQKKVYIIIGCLFIVGALSIRIYLSRPSKKRVVVSSGQPKIAIIGAGLAGLTTAYRLKQQGYANIHIYEARNRVGGRVLSAYLECPRTKQRRVIELGGNDIADGGAAEHIRDLVAEVGLVIATTEQPINCLHHVDCGTAAVSSADLLASPIDFNNLHDYLTQLSVSAHTMAEVLTRLCGDDAILYKTLRILIEEEEGGPVEQLSTECVSTLENFLRRDSSILAAHADGKKSYGRHLYLPDGNSTLPEKLALLLEDHISLDAPVRSISRGISREHGSYCIDLGYAQEYADIVVITVPCSVYKNIDIDATVLSDERKNEFEHVLYGQNAKIFLPIHGRGKDAACYTNGRMVADQTYCPDIALLYYINHYGVFDAYSIDSVLSEDSKVLAIAYGQDIVPATAVIAEDLPFITYTQPVGYCWITDPYAKGSYACVSSKQEAIFSRLSTYGGEIVRELFAPVDDTLFFAGEHTTIDLAIIGTMEAAVESGDRTARMIMQRYPA